MKHYIVALIVMMLVSGCASASAHKISKVKLGMTRAEVIKVMGKPTSVSAQGETEYLNYALSETDQAAGRGWTTPYFVRLISGKVDSYGRTGDFDSTRTPAVRIESNSVLKQETQLKGNTDLYSELAKLKELKDSGVITEEEFQVQKKKVLEKY